MKVLRSNVLVDTGELVDPTCANGTSLIVPDICKRINNFGIILGIAKGCKFIDKSMVGKKCLLKANHHDDYRIRPRTSEKCGLKKTWHFIIDEEFIQAVIDD